MQLSEAEWRVMRVVWAGEPATVRDVLEALEDETGWAYSTVKTILARLVEKGALSATKRANTSRYVSRISRDDARRSAVQSLLDRAFDGTFGSLVHHVLGQQKLSARERARLRTMLDETDGGSISRRRR